MQHELDHLDGILFPDRVEDPTTFCTWEMFRAHREDGVARRASSRCSSGFPGETDDADGAEPGDTLARWAFSSGFDPAPSSPTASPRPLPEGGVTRSAMPAFGSAAATTFSSSPANSSMSPVAPIPATISALIDDRPDLTGDARTDALLGGLGEYLASISGVPAPPWTQEQERFLDCFWFVSDQPGFRAIALAQSPIALKRRGIFWPARSLTRV